MDYEKKLFALLRLAGRRCVPAVGQTRARVHRFVSYFLPLRAVLQMEPSSIGGFKPVIRAESNHEIACLLVQKCSHW